jgi:hypothetical protein
VINGFLRRTRSAQIPIKGMKRKPETLSSDMMMEVREGDAPNPKDGVLRLASKIGFPDCRKMGIKVLYRLLQRLNAIPPIKVTRIIRQ